MTSSGDALREQVRELERAAALLRSGDASGEQAAELVERCAELAGSVVQSLEAEGRAVGDELPLDDAPEQERLL